MNLRLQAIVLFLIINSLSLFSQSTIYVNHNAAGSNNGLDWLNAYNDLHDALDAAQYGDEIWIAEGPYFPHTGSDRNIYFELDSGIKLIGGFVGAEASVDERNLEEHFTVISGNIGDPNDSTDNSNTLLYLIAPDSNSIIDGIVFEHGFASSDSIFDNFSPLRSGGAIYVDPAGMDAVPTIRNCVFRHCFGRGYGAAYFCDQTEASKYNQPLFSNCKFIDNYVFRDGGAVYLNGGIAKDNGIDFNQCEFLANKSELKGGAIVFKWDENASSNIEFIRSTFDNNRAGTWAGVFHQYLPSSGSHNYIIDSCFFTNNYAATGPAIIEVSSLTLQNTNGFNLSITNNYISGNEAIENLTYSAIINFDLIGYFINNYTISNNIISNNKASKFLSNFELTNQSTFNFSKNRLINNVYINEDPMELFNLEESDPIKIDVTGNLILSGRQTFIVKTKGTWDNPLNIANNLFADLIMDHRVFAVTTTIEDNLEAQNIRIVNNLFLNNKTLRAYINRKSSRRHKVYNNIFFNNRNVETDALEIPMRLENSFLELSHNYADFPCINFPDSIECGPGHIFNTALPFLDTTNFNFQLDPCSPAVNGGDNDIVAQINLLADMVGAVRIQDDMVDIGPLESSMLQLAAAPVITPACNGDNGSATFQIDHACLPLSFEWTNGNLSGVGLQNLEAGTYEVTISDNNEKTMITDLIIPGSSPQIEFDADTLICPSGVTTIATTVSGAAGNPEYHWSDGTMNAELINVGPGWYSLTITDSIGCTSADSILINQTPLLESETVTAPASGPDQPDGSILVEVQSGLGPYSYLWSTGDTTPLVTGLLPDDYHLTITDGAGCQYVYLIQLGYTSANGAVAIDELVNVFPNPASSFLNVNPGKYSRFLLFDSKGRLVKQANVNGPEQVSLEGIPSGSYLFVLKGNRLIPEIGSLKVVR